MGSGETGLKSAILFYSVIDILAGSLTWFLLKGGSAQSIAKPKNGLANLLEAIKDISEHARCVADQAADAEGRTGQEALERLYLEYSTS
ncbi:hypothetical protein ABH904_002796 [Pseudomonas frederiksbergensis]